MRWFKKYPFLLYLQRILNLITMKKLIALLMVCGFAFAFVACGGAAKTDESKTDSTAAPVEVAPAPDTTVKADSVAQ
jgi:hypothetical protein